MCGFNILNDLLFEIHHQSETALYGFGGECVQTSAVSTTTIETLSLIYQLFSHCCSH